ncbi:MAG: DUF4302 domain-containing protein [Prevotella sp.]|nr:DUF4302 domain-containing protein [Prevotella sp.]
MLYFYVAAAALLLTACTDEVEDKFDQSATARLTAVMDRARSVLRGAEYGWEFEYYPGAGLDYGGLVYTVRFDSLTVDVSCSLIPDSTVTSHYRITNDNGPVLTFDTYNDLLHYYSTPSSGEYQAKGGEYEFVIDSIADDFISLYGKKTGNTMYLRRLSASTTDYARRTIDIYDHFVDSISGTLGNAELLAKCNPTNRSISVFSGGDTLQVHYTYTDRGIRLYRPLRLGGVSVQSFDFDAQTNVLTCTDAGSEGVQLQGIPYAAGFMNFSRYEGDYTLTYEGSQVDVHLQPNRLEGNYILSGLSPKYTLTLDYDTATGDLRLGSQVIGESEGRTVYWVCYDYTDGYLSLNNDGQFTIRWNGNRFYPRFGFITTNPNVLNCDGGLLVYLFYNDAGQLSAGILDDPAWLTNGSQQFRGLNSLNRKTRLD